MDTYGTVLAYEEREGGDSSVYIIDYLDLYGPRWLPAHQLASTHHPSEGYSRDGARQLLLRSWGEYHVGLRGGFRVTGRQRGGRVWGSRR
jgi:hypothetical protein